MSVTRAQQRGLVILLTLLGLLILWRMFAR
jgi:hypothetical protein